MAAVTPPRAPRAMVQRMENDQTNSMGDFTNEVAKLYPRLVLYEALAVFKGEHKPRTRSNDNLGDIRRNFLDSFSYLCDVEKGGATVTAAALEKLQHSNILWLAANEGVRSNVEEYANRIRMKLEKADEGNRKVIEREIFLLAVEQCRPRIDYYKAQLQKCVKSCRDHLDHEVQSDKVKVLTDFAEVIQRIKNKDLIETCYESREGLVPLIKKMSKSENDNFAQMAHYIGRLGSTSSAANTIVKAWLRVPALAKISAIRTVDIVPTRREVLMTPEFSSPYEIVRAICTESPLQNPLDIQRALRAIVEHDLPHLPTNDTLRNRLRAQKLITRVHAELQLADKLSRKTPKMRFVDDDRYIGCSKPACYFCYNWLSMHKHGYARPATHLKIIAGCRGSDVELNENGRKVLKEMYTKMCKTVGQDIIDFLVNSQSGSARPMQHHMSTEGSSVATSQVLAKLSLKNEMTLAEVETLRHEGEKETFDVY